MDHSRHIPLQAAEINPGNVLDAPVYGANDEKVGTVSHLHGQEVVVDVGGFLGLGAKAVGVNLADLQFMRDEDGMIHAKTGWTKDQLKAMPEHHH